jgi:hypothetical protein
MVHDLVLVTIDNGDLAGITFDDDEKMSSKLFMPPSVPCVIILVSRFVPSLSVPLLFFALFGWGSRLLPVAPARNTP